MAAIISDIRYMYASADRAAVTENLRVIFPEKTPAEIGRIRRRMFRNFARYLVDFFRFEKMDEAYMRSYIRVENIGVVDNALAKGKGAIILTAHIGNWELGGVVMGILKYPFWAVALAHKDRRINGFFNEQRGLKGVNVIPLGRAVRMCLKLLSDNKIVALVGDRDFTETGPVFDFFGRRAVFPEGAAAFALKTGAPIIPGFLVRNSDDTFTLKFESPLEFTPGPDREACARAIIGRCVRIIERYIRMYPDQWYMFRRFWV